MKKPLPPLAVYSLLLVAGGMQTLTLAPFNLWLLGPISIAILLWATQLISPTTIKAKTASKYGWVFGLGLFGSGASWVYVSINTYGHAPPLLASALTLFFVAGLALFCALNFWLFAKAKGTKVGLNAALFVTIWVLGDGFRTIFLTGFPWLFLGYGHLESPLAGWIPVVGVYGITGLIVLTGTLLVLFIPSVSSTQTQPALRKQSVLAVVFSIALLWLAGPVLNQVEWTRPLINAEGSTQTHTVALLQTNIPQEEKWKPRQRLKTMKLLESMSAEQWDKDLIVWPETAVPQLYDLAKRYLDRIGKLAQSHDTTIISGIPYRHIDTTHRQQILHNSIVSFGDGEGIYHKQKLVPFGEYVPLQEILRGLIQFFDLPMSDFRTGSPNQAPLQVGPYQTSPFICYEVVYPDFVASHAVPAQYLLTISNDSWFGASIGPIQHLEMARYRAAENGKFMVRGTNNGISAMINEKGDVVAQSEQFVKTTLESEVELRTGRTPFSLTGSYPLFLFCGAIILYGLFRRRQA